MTQQTITVANYAPGAGKLQHEWGIADGDTAEWNDVVYDSTDSVVTGLTFAVNADLTIEVVVASGADEPDGNTLRMKQVRFYHEGAWSDYESYEIPTEKPVVELTAPSEQQVIYYTTDSGVELNRSTL